MNEKKPVGPNGAPALTPLNEEVLTGLSIEELEDRLEMQILGSMPVVACTAASTYTTIHYER